MERFVQSVLIGGVALVAGLWLARLFATGSPLWVLGTGLTVIGVVGLLFGIGSELEVDRR